MLNGYIIASSLVAISFILLGLLILSRNSRSSHNRLFFIFSFCVAIWLLSNYSASSSTIPLEIAKIANRSVFLFASAGVLSLLLFVKSLTRRRTSSPERLLLFVHVLLLISSATPLVVKSIHAVNDTYVIGFGPLSTAYFLLLALTVLAAIQNLLVAQKSTEGVLKSQIDVILASFAFGSFGVLLTNAFMPFVFDYYGLTNAGSFFSCFFVAGTAYAIVRHKLFDIRLIVARSLAYLLALASLGSIYAGIIFSFSRVLPIETEPSALQEIFYITAAMILAVTFQPLKRFFDRLTNTVFYRDAYDPQVFLDGLNKVLVGNVDLIPLLRNTCEIIERNYKTEYCLFAINATDTAKQRIIGHNLKGLAKNDIEQLKNLIHSEQSNIMSRDDLGPDQEALRESMQQHDISIIARLSTGAGRLTESKSIGYLVLGSKKSGNPYSPQDIQLLEIIVNELVITIQNALRFEQIENFNITLQQKVTDATRRLRATNEKLRLLDQTKDEFISMASHQLRTPLTSVKGYVSMVLEGDAGKITPMQRKLLDQAFVSSQRMVYLIADLLNVSRLRTGKFVIEAKPTNLADLVEGEIAQLVETAKGRNLELVYDKPAEFPSIMLDETKTRQVVMNFVDNAIYYTPSGGRIEVHVTETAESIEFTVVDNGIGVPKSEQHQLFNKFYRAGNAKKARPDGTGLGLYMAQKVIIAQGGAIIFKTQEGKGSTFGFCFAKAKLLAPTPDKKAAAPVTA